MSFDPRSPTYVQQVGRSVTRTKRSGAWHTWQVTLIVLTGGLWFPVYLYKLAKGRSTYTETRHVR